VRRAYLFSGIGRFGIEHTAEMIWVLLHAFVSFFFIGLIDFLLLIGDKIVAWVILEYIGPLVYITTTLLPRIFSNSHYFTPFSSESWKVLQLHNRRPRSLPPFCHPPYIGENSWRDDCEFRDRQVAAPCHP